MGMVTPRGRQGKRTLTALRQPPKRPTRERAGAPHVQDNIAFSPQLRKRKLPRPTHRACLCAVALCGCDPWQLCCCERVLARMHGEAKTP
eukprot:scaffold5212_cov108-Isochrysis_galbana.AAC.4